MALASGLCLPAFAQINIPVSGKLPVSAADTSKPGFLWRVHQVASSQPTSLVRTEAQLAGQLGDNIADPSAAGGADDVAAAPNPATAPIEFVVSTFIDFEQSGGSSGNFTPDLQMPGIPGTTGSTDNIAAEVLTWLELPAGEITMGVNSDDGFRVLIGGANPVDKFGTKVGEFDGGRGAADTIFRFTIAEAGLYAARLIYNEGGGGANVEWFTQKADGTKVLVNDTANGGVKAYRAVTGSAAAASLTKINPGVGESGVFPNAAIALELTEGGSTIDVSTVKLTIDGTPVTVTPTKTGKVISITSTPSTLYAPGSKHTVNLAYTENGTVKNATYTFTVAAYGTLAPLHKVTPDTSKPGFLWNVFANALNTTTSNARAESALAGTLTDADGFILENTADPSAEAPPWRSLLPRILLMLLFVSRFPE